MLTSPAPPPSGPTLPAPGSPSPPEITGCSAVPTLPSTGGLLSASAGLVHRRLKRSVPEMESSFVLWSPDRPSPPSCPSLGPSPTRRRLRRLSRTGFWGLKVFGGWHCPLHVARPTFSNPRPLLRPCPLPSLGSPGPQLLACLQALHGVCGVCPLWHHLSFPLPPLLLQLGTSHSVPLWTSQPPSTPTWL